MAYLITIITMILGVLGILFSKQGKRAPIRPIGYVLLSLLVTSGVISLFDSYLKERAAEQREQSAQQLLQENRRIKAELQSVRLASFDLGKPPKTALFLLDYSENHRLHRQDMAGFLPILGKIGVVGRLWIQVSDILAMHGLLEVFLRGEEQVTSISNADEKWAPNDKESGRWLLEEFGSVYAVGANLKGPIGNQSMRRILSELSVYQRISYIEIDYPSTAENIKRLTEIFAKISAYFKFYVDLRTKDGDECVSVFFIPLRFAAPSQKNPEKIVFELYRDGAEIDISECERTNL